MSDGAKKRQGLPTYALLTPALISALLQFLNGSNFLLMWVYLFAMNMVWVRFRAVRERIEGRYCFMNCMSASTLTGHCM